MVGQAHAPPPPPAPPAPAPAAPAAPLSSTRLPLPPSGPTNSGSGAAWLADSRRVNATLACAFTASVRW